MNFTQAYAPLSLSPMGQKIESTRIATTKSYWTKALVLAGLICSPLPRLDAQTSFATGYDQHWNYEDCNGHIWQIVFTYGSGSFGYMDLTQAANAQPAAPGTKLSSFSTATDQHWVYQTNDGDIQQIVFTYSTQSFSTDDLTADAGIKPGMLYSGLTSFATTYDQHWVYQTGEGDIREIVYTYTTGQFSTNDLTQRAGAPPGAFYAELSSFTTTTGEHWIYQTNDGDIHEIVFTYGNRLNNGAFSTGNLTQEAGALPSVGGLTSFATSTDEHWVFQTSDGRVHQIVFTYRTRGFSNDDLTQRAGTPAQNYALPGTGLGSFVTSTDQHWVFQSSDGHIRQIVFTYSTGRFSNDDLNQRAAGSPLAGLYCMAH